MKGTFFFSQATNLKDDECEDRKEKVERSDALLFFLKSKLHKSEFRANSQLGNFEMKKCRFLRIVPSCILNRRRPF